MKAYFSGPLRWISGLFPLLLPLQNVHAQAITEGVNLDNPNLGDVGLLILSVIRFGIAIIGGVVILIIIYGGYKFATGYFNEEKSNDEARQTIINGVLGLTIVLGAYLIISFIQAALTSEF